MNLKIIAVLIALNLFANLKANTILQADSAYNNNDYGKAIELYEQAIHKGNANSKLYYNLGNAYYQNNQIGKAVLNYEKSIKIDPSNDKAIHNLDILYAKVNDINELELSDKNGDVSAEAITFWDSIYNAIAKKVHSDVWAICAIISFLILIAGVTVYIFVKNVTMRKIGFFGGIVALCFTIIFIIFAYMAYTHYYDNSECVITEYQTILKAEPDENSQDIGSPLHSGTKLKILQSSETTGNQNWLKVRLNSDYIGWINNSEVGIITIK